MRKFLVALCSMAIIIGSISPTQIFAAGSSVYEEDGDIINNPWGEVFSTAPEETTTKKEEETTTKKEEETTKKEEETTSQVAVQSSNKIRIRIQPQDVVSKTGKTVRLMMSAESADALVLSYQWQISADGGKTWSNSSASGAKTNTMQFTMSNALSGRMARCVVTDTAGNVAYTEAATITVGTPEELKIVSQPNNVYGNVGEWAFSTFEATGNGVMYKWEMSSDGGKTWKATTARGFNSNTVYFRMIKSYAGRMVRCIAIDANLNQVTSEPATIALGNGPAKVVSQPYSISAAVGDKVTFGILAAGSGLTYQWQISTDGGKTWSNSSASGSKTNTMQFTMSKSLAGRCARCVVKDSAGNTVYSEPGYISLAQ